MLSFLRRLLRGRRAQIVWRLKAGASPTPFLSVLWPPPVRGDTITDAFEGEAVVPWPERLKFIQNLGTPRVMTFTYPDDPPPKKLGRPYSELRQWLQTAAVDDTWTEPCRWQHGQGNGAGYRCNSLTFIQRMEALLGIELDAVCDGSNLSVRRTQ